MNKMSGGKGLSFPRPENASSRAIDREKGGALRRIVLTKLQHRPEGPSKARIYRMSRFLALSTTFSTLLGLG